MNKKKFLLLILIGILGFIGNAKSYAFTGTTLTDGGQYYLYNLYQSKFLSYGNTWGTQVSLDNSKPLLCTINASGTGYTINTHYSLTDKAYKSTYDNYISIVDGTPVVNANYGDADDSYTTRAAQVFTFTAVDGGYNITYDNSGTTMALMFSAGTACTVADISTGFNDSKSVWKLVSADEYNAYKAKTRFTVAAMNVDGMPKSLVIGGISITDLNPDGKEGDGATAIGAKLTTMGYDVVGVSENFNYNSELIAAAGSVYSEGTHQGGINVVASSYTKYLSKSSPVFDIDGLNLLWKTNGVSATNEAITSWNEHYGFSDSGADGLIDKGYRYYTVTLSEGNAIDVYILHMDAETSAGDIAARESQLTQLVTAIKATNNGRPIIIMGDTNCRYTRDRLKTLLIDAINADSRFKIKDAWVEYGRDGSYPTCGASDITASEAGYLKGEVVDKVFYINNTESNIRIKALNYTQDLSFVDDSGNALSDHWPTVVEFDYHTYNPVIDDEPEATFSGNYYFRNKETGAYLKAGGWWGTHAVQGNYGKAMLMTQLSNGKYTIGGLTQGDPYTDSNTPGQWTLVESDGYYSFTYDDNGTTKALTGNDATTFPDSPGPNTRYVTCSIYSNSDDYQKWQILSESEMLEIVKQGTAAKPVNATHLFPGANFDSNDTEGNSKWVSDVSSTANRMTCTISNGKNDFAFGNSLTEVFVKSANSGSTTWKVQNELTGLPDGVYRVTCQAFQRISNSTSTTADIYVHAVSGSNSSSKMVPLMYTEPKITDSSFGGTTQADGYYYPNSMAEATLYFNAGYYQMTLDNVKVENGTLTVYIDKTSDTGVNNTAWTCFDNFQIYYLGEIADGDQYYIYNVDGGAFLTNGNNAETQASLSSTGTLWTAHIVSGDNSGYTLSQTTATKSSGDICSGSLFTAWNGLYVDGADAGVWDICEISDGIYNITSTDHKTLVGWGGDPGCTVVAPALLPNDKEPRGTRWMLMSASDYSTYQSGLSTAFSARQAAWPIMRSAKANGVDYSSLQTAYDKLDATSTEISTAADAVKQSIITMAANEASVTKPVEVSFYINNATCGYSNFTGWTNTNFGSNITSMPNNGNDIALAPRFYEKWVASPGTLASTGSFSQTLSNLPNGCYYLVADGIAVQQDGASAAVTGTILYADDKEVTVNTPDGTVAKFTTDPFVVDDGTAEIGFKLTDCTANWVAIDNFRLYYVGGTEVNLVLSPTAKRGTFCAPYDVTLPDNVTAWQVRSESKDGGTRTLTLKQVDEDGVLAAGTPVILRLSDEYAATLSGNLKQTYYGISTTSKDLHGDGYLRGVYRDDETSISVGNYLLQSQNNVVAFYKITTKPLTVSKYRSYLLGSTNVSESKAILKFADNAETAIDDLGRTSESIEDIYSVSGTKLNKLQHGVNIIRMSDGSVKKVLVK